MRDNNVSRIYALEGGELPAGTRFEDKEEIQYFVDWVVESDYWRAKRRAPKAVEVYDWGDNPYSEQKKRNEVWLARKHWYKQVVLHELAHMLAPAGHGPAWVREYLGLVRAFMGTEFERIYRGAFLREGVRIAK